MSWQKCPICDGTGKGWVSWGLIKGEYGPKYDPCKTCLGHGIINKLTGKPPSGAGCFLDERIAREEVEKMVMLGEIE